jgi:hypothetical protein
MMITVDIEYFDSTVDHWQRISRKPHHWDVTDLDTRWPVPQEKKVTSVESWGHRLRDDTHNWNRRCSQDTEAFPRHECGAQREEDRKRLCKGGS